MGKHNTEFHNCSKYCSSDAKIKTRTALRVQMVFLVKCAFVCALGRW